MPQILHPSAETERGSEWRRWRNWSSSLEPKQLLLRPSHGLIWLQRGALHWQFEGRSEVTQAERGR